MPGELAKFQIKKIVKPDACCVLRPAPGATSPAARDRNRISHSLAASTVLLQPDVPTKGGKPVIGKAVLSAATKQRSEFLTRADKLGLAAVAVGLLAGRFV